MESNEKTLTVVALGGNAILKPGQEGTAKQQIENVNETTSSWQKWSCRGVQDRRLSR